MQAQTPHATAVAYPLMPNQTNPSQPSPSLDPSLFNVGLDQSTFSTNDSIDLGNNFFSQLDSMIAAVKVESNALDTMREKLKEVDNLRSQISTFTKRIIDADQLNLNLKTNLVKQQEAYNELKRQKTEVESNAVSLRQELNRTKDALNKERVARQQLQQEISQIREQYARLEVLRDNLDREVKTIPALTESNEILKNDINNIRRRFKEEKASLTKHIKYLESQAKDVESIKGEVRQLGMRLMEISGSSIGSTMNYAAVTSNTNANTNTTQRYDMNSYRNTTNPPPTNSSALPPPSKISYDEDDDDDLDNEEGSYYGAGENESEYDNHSFVDDNMSQLSVPNVNSSLDSIPLHHQHQQQHQQQSLLQQMHHQQQQNNSNKTSSGGTGKKKKVKKAVVTSTRPQHASVSQPMNMMSNNMGGGMQTSFSLPRI